ncbi:hypothetical protein B0H10DRAFT_2435975 [Mycena sp. CBHHK59/15]|nr:hypothetical protein B0H10DRAFT_2435975 [Mycena sp. CBHHK59/15]
MSILVGSVYTSSVTFSPTSAGTVLSRRFVSSRFPSFVPLRIYDQRRSSWFLYNHWKASVREWIIGLGLRPTNGFELEILHAVPPSTSLAAASREAVSANSPSVHSPHSAVLSAPFAAPSAPKTECPFHVLLHAAAAAIGTAPSRNQSATLASSPGVHAHLTLPAMYVSAPSLPGVYAHQGHATYASASSLPDVYAHQGHAHAHVDYRPAYLKSKPFAAYQSNRNESVTAGHH